MNKLKIIGIELLILQCIVSVGLSMLLGQSGLLPTGQFILLVFMLVVLLAAAGILVIWKDKNSHKIIGITLALLFSAGIFTAFFMISPAVTMLQAISSDYNESVKVSVYVRKEDPAQTLQDVKDYSFGILYALDRENTNAAVAGMEEKLGQTLELRAQDSLTTLADALTLNEVEAIVLNESLLAVLDEIEGYEQFKDSIREISNEEVAIVTVTEEPKQEKDNSVFTVYISGIDGWGGIEGVGRSDVNIIATVNTETKQVLLVSTPRDYFVELPISNGTRDKLTHAGIYGIECSKGTLEQLYQIDIDYYFRLNFSGFESIIDTLGGIVVYSDYDFTVDEYHYLVGMNHMSGLSALAFARERYTLPGGDLDRGENQMKIIKATLSKCMSPAILGHYTEVLEHIEGNFQTDMSYDMITSLVRMQLKDGSEWNIQTYSVTGTGKSSSTYSIPNASLYVMEPDIATVEQAMEYMQRVRVGEEIHLLEE